MSDKIVLEEVIEILSGIYNEPVKLNNSKQASGGSINQSVFLYTTAGNFFLKTNSAVRFPGMFECESKGLDILRETNSIKLPEVVHYGVVQDAAYLLLSMIERAPGAADYWQQAGRSLAMLHKNSGNLFGLDHDNYIGSLPQSNKQTESGTEFMIKQRYEPMIQMALKKKLISKNEVALFDRFMKRLDDLLPDEKPSLMHGDLWNGNIITGPEGGAWFIDPAVYYGYRETDLAMAHLFGGFDMAFFESYQDAFPLLPEAKDRVELFQLYPLLVHLNLFGSGYLQDVLRIVKKYS